MAAHEKSRNPPWTELGSTQGKFKAGKGARQASHPRERRGALAQGFRFVHVLHMGDPAAAELVPPMPGQRLARGVSRMLAAMGHAPLTEFVPSAGLRVDVVSIAPDGEIWIVECKSCRADFMSDGKWHGYLDYCDRFFWATDCDFPTGLLPDASGLIVADAWGAEVARMAPRVRLAAARRARILREVARCASLRLLRAIDPAGADPV